MSIRFFFSNNKAFHVSIGEEGIVVIYTEKSKVLNKIFVRSTDLSDSQKLIQLINSDANAPIYLYIDILDQSYLQKVLPAISPIGINRVAHARLDKDIPKDFLKTCVQLGRNSIGRRDWVYTYISVHMEPPITTWLDFFLPFPNIIRGLYFLPVEIGGLLVKTRPFKPPAVKIKRDLKSYLDYIKERFFKKGPATWDIVVSHHKTGGFRQIAYRNDKIVFSRLLNNINDPDLDVVAGNIEQEVSNSIEYLSRLALGIDEPASVHIILSKEILKFIREDKIKADKINFYTPYNFAEKLGVVEAASSEKDKFSDPIILAGLSKYPSRLITLHTPQTKLPSLAYNIVSWVHSLSYILIPLLTLIIIYQSTNIFNLRSYSKTFEERINSLNTQIDSKHRMLTHDETVIKEKIPLSQITEIVEVRKVLNKYSQDPINFFLRLSEIIPQYAKVTNITWHYDDSELSNPAKSLNIVNLADLNENRQFGIKVKIIFKLINFGTTYEELLAKYNIFSQQLKTQFSKYDVKISNLPETFTIQDFTKEVIINVDIKYGTVIETQTTIIQTGEQKLLEEYKIPIK